MRLNFAERADLAYHSLAERDQKRVAKALSLIEAGDPASLLLLPTLKRFPKKQGRALWILKVSPQLRLIASINDGEFKVEDIVPRDRLERAVGKYGV